MNMNMSTSAAELTITRTLNVRRELVWRAWTEKKELAAWLPSTPLESISFDVREGGQYRCDRPPRSSPFSRCPAKSRRSQCL
jgi:uncharacterized protein YndB with AHSA1/START domain